MVWEDIKFRRPVRIIKGFYEGCCGWIKSRSVERSWRTGKEDRTVWVILTQDYMGNSIEDGQELFTTEDYLEGIING